MSTDAIVLRKMTTKTFANSSTTSRSPGPTYIENEVMHPRVRELLPENGGGPRSYLTAGKNGAWRRG